MEEKIGIELRRLNNAVRRYFERSSTVLKELDNLTCSNKWIMGYFFDEEQKGRDVFQRDLEENFGITRSTVSKVLALLEKKGLISRESVSHDARLKKIVLTEKSREIERTMRCEGEEMEEHLTSGFSPEELKALFGYLERMKENMSKSIENSRAKGDNKQ